MMLCPGLELKYSSLKRVPPGPSLWHCWIGITAGGDFGIALLVCERAFLF